ncbi:MAG TPA: carboxypeptidase-like regulatory domain-containing protein [Gemmatimonadaceae bacterium]|nr:carboxypeptidase-like regulatory domain-containing protein [Gemmatimonadaceae bacterium]
MSLRLFWIAVLALVPSVIRAQVGVTTDIITGQVTSPDGHPVPGVNVRVISAETQIGRNTITNKDGRYTVVFPDGGGNYRVEARFVGFQPTRITINRQADEDRLVANIQLGSSIPVLNTVTTTARRNQPRGDAGGTGRGMTSQQLERLPIDATDPNTIATLAPGVVGIGSTDTTNTAFSVAGQRQTLNNFTLDGVTFSGSAIPTEAVRGTRVITNTYDVSRGQFTGGQVASTTRGGTNVASGSFSYYFRNPSLAFGEQGPSAFQQLRNQNQLSGGVGGPIMVDHIFSFSAIQLSRRSDDLVDLANDDPATLAQLGVPQSTVTNFLRTLEARGIPITNSLVPDERAVDNLTAFQRFDFLIGDNNSIVVRGDFRGRMQDGQRVSPYTLPTAGGHLDGAGGGLFLSLTTHFSGNFINEIRTYGQRDYQSTSPYLSGLAGRVNVLPETTSTSTGITTFGFGGNPGLPQSGYTDLWESTDEISWLSPRGGHRVRLGFLLDVGRSSQLFNFGTNGVYSYNSLAAFDSNQATAFTRSFNANAHRAGSLSGATYIGDTWVPWSPLQLTYGARIEGTEYTGAPAENGQVEHLFGLNTSYWPSEIHVSPRIGFTYFVRNPNGPPAAVIRGGFGEFRANAPLSLFSSAQSENGLASGESQLICIGSGVPFDTTAGWNGYLNGSTPIPSACNQSGGVTDSVPLRQVAAFDRDFESPRAWRGSLGIQRRLFGALNASVDYTYARGVALFGVTDANLNTSNPIFVHDEGNRPIYSSDIDPTTGAVSYTGSRKYGQFGQVWDINSRLQSETHQVTVALNGFTLRGIAYSLAYTYQHARDQTSFPGGSASYGFQSATTGGNPNEIGWGTSDLQRQHQFIGTLTWPVTPSFEITTIGRLNSGTPYTPIVNQDINGDGTRNDRAFVFNPSQLAAYDSAYAAPMKTLLNSGSARIRDCLRSQLGEIAGRNSCTGPWAPALDLQFNYRPGFFGLNRKLTLSVLAVNSLTGLDELVHGSNHLAGWGQAFPPDNVLLYVKGYDQVNNHFIYQVNQHFGQPYSAYGAFAAPFQLVFQARFSFGDVTDLRSMFGGRGGGGDGGRPGGPGGAGGAGGAPQSLADQIADRFAQRFPNPFDQILELKDTLSLTPDEIGKLTAASDSLKTKIATLRTHVSTQLAKLGNNPDPGTLMSLLRPELLEARGMSRGALTQAQAILTPEQWNKVPASIKTPRQGGPGGGGPR